MVGSPLQDEFLRVLADGHRATADRIIKRLMSLGLQPALEGAVRDAVRDEIRGLLHGSLVVLDGGSSLADHGLIKIVDEDGLSFATNMHETCFQFFDAD